MPSRRSGCSRSRDTERNRTVESIGRRLPTEAIKYGGGLRHGTFWVGGLSRIFLNWPGVPMVDCGIEAWKVSAPFTDTQNSRPSSHLHRLRPLPTRITDCFPNYGRTLTSKSNGFF